MAITLEREQMARTATLAEVDPEVAAAVRHEEERQQHTLELIASENFVSRAVLEAAGTVLTNKYAEGLPGKRYYGGCEFVDVVEDLARERAKQLFGAEHANVQPHSGSQANMGAYLAVLKPGDTMLGMNLSAGGHLTHGGPQNFSGKLFNVIPYGVRPDNEQIDYDELERLAKEHHPKLVLAGASAYPRIIDFARFRQIADAVGAVFMVDMAHIAGLVAAGVHPSPVPHADIVTTTTHKTLRGPRAGLILCRAAYAEAIDKMVMPGIQGGPLMHIIAAKAVCLKEAMQPEFRAYQQQIVRNARALATRLSDLGWRLVSGGTENHLMLVDLRPQGLTGKDAQTTLDDVGITINKNPIPFDPEKPWISSGIRIGTPAVTTRGMQEPEMTRIAELIDRTLRHREDDGVKQEVRRAVRELCDRFPF